MGNVAAKMTWSLGNLLFWPSFFHSDGPRNVVGPAQLGRETKLDGPRGNKYVCTYRICTAKEVDMLQHDLEDLASFSCRTQCTVQVVVVATGYSAISAGQQILYIQ